MTSATALRSIRQQKESAFAGWSVQQFLKTLSEVQKRAAVAKRVARLATWQMKLFVHGHY
jgi:hypothetical protein